MSPNKWKSDYDVVLAWQAKISEAAAPFEARWSEAGLRRVNPDLYARFKRQRQLFDLAVKEGSLDEVVTHGGAMARGYLAAFAAMQAAEPDDAYQIGRGPNGLMVAIGPKPCCARVQELYGDAVQWFSPDEVATIIELDARFKTLAEIKRKFPGAEINS